jgi:hypothetical protein
MSRFVWPVVAAGIAAGLAAGIHPAVAQTPTTTLVYPPWSHCYGLHRVNQTHLTLRAGFRYKFDDPQGLVALKLAAEDDPQSRRDDDELTVFGVNSGQGMLIYNTSITTIAFYGRPGSGVGEFRRPHGVAADRDGHVVVADTGNDRLHVLQYANDALTHVRFIAGNFNGKPLRGPMGVALEGGEVYVCDPDENRILVLDLEGNLRRELRPERDGKPLLQEPFSIAVIRPEEGMNFFGEDFVVVTDSMLSRVWKLDHDGHPFAVRRVREVARGGEFTWAAIDYYGNVYCSDRGGRIHKFDRELRFLLSIGRPGRGEYEFDEPRGLGLYRRFGQLFVAEREGAQYLWIGTDVFTPSVADLKPDPGGGWSLHVRFFLTEYAQVKLDLADRANQPVAPLQPAQWTAPGPVDRELRFQAPAGNEPLHVRIEATPTYSARKVLTVVKSTPPLAFGPSGKR